MSQIMNWLCLICISLLVCEIMIQFCKDALKILCEVEVPRAKKSNTIRKNKDIYAYEHKIAK